MTMPHCRCENNARFQQREAYINFPYLGRQLYTMLLQSSNSLILGGLIPTRAAVSGTPFRSPAAPATVGAGVATNTG